MTGFRKIIFLLLAVVAFLSFQEVQAQRAKDCGLCYGTGKCQTCYGKGGETHHYGHHISYRDCGACGGTGRCSHCNGSGLDPNQDYTADISAINAAASAASGPDNPKKHSLEARTSQYEAVKFTTNDEKNWLVEKGSAKVMPDSWSLVGNFTQFGEDANYWFIRQESDRKKDIMAIPKNSYGNVMTPSGDSWETMYYMPHDYRFVNIDDGNYCYQKTFYGPVWLKMAKPYGGTGMMSLEAVFEETREDDNYWYLKNGGTELRLSKTGNEVGKSSNFTPVEPSSLDKIEKSDVEESDEEYDNDKSVVDVLMKHNKRKSERNKMLMWISFVLLAMLAGALCMYKYMKRKQKQNVPQNGEQKNNQYEKPLKFSGETSHNSPQETKDNSRNGTEQSRGRSFFVPAVLLVMLFGVVFAAMVSKGMAILLALLFVVIILIYKYVR